MGVPGRACVRACMDCGRLVTFPGCIPVASDGIDSRTEWGTNILWMEGWMKGWVSLISREDKWVHDKSTVTGSESPTPPTPFLIFQFNYFHHFRGDPVPKSKHPEEGWAAETPARSNYYISWEAEKLLLEKNPQKNPHLFPVFLCSAASGSHKVGIVVSPLWSDQSGRAALCLGST